MINSFLANSNQLLGCLGECGGFIKAQLERETWWWALCATGSDWRMAGLRLNQHWGNNTGLRAEKYQTIFKTQTRTWCNSKVPHCIYIQLGRKRWHPTPILLPGKSHGRRSLVGCSQWGREESDTTERLPFITFQFVHWRRKWQPTPVFLPGESQGGGSLVGCRLRGHTESDTTEVT